MKGQFLAYFHLIDASMVHLLHWCNSVNIVPKVSYFHPKKLINLFDNVRIYRGKNKQNKRKSDKWMTKNLIRYRFIFACILYPVVVALFLSIFYHEFNSQLALISSHFYDFLWCVVYILFLPFFRICELSVVMDGFYCTNAINFSCQCAAAASEMLFSRSCFCSNFLL